MIKHNYTNAECKRVILTLSKDNKSLYYRDIAPNSKLYALLKGRRVIRFSEIKGFLYGAVSETFEHRRRDVVGAMLFQKTLTTDPHNLMLRKRGSIGNSHNEQQSVFTHQSPTKVLQRLKTMKLSEYSDLFYSWECVSLVLENYTVDFVIKDMYHMMYFIHVLQHFTMQAPPAGAQGCLKPFKMLKLKMKLAYQCWLKQITL